MIKKEEHTNLNMSMYEAFACRLVNNDDFRTQFENDPKGCLENAGAPTSIIESCPDSIQLPEKGAIAAKLAELRAQQPTAPQYEAMTRPHKFW